MDMNTHFTLKQHITFLALSLIVSSTCLYLDLQTGSLIEVEVAKVESNQSEINFSSYELDHSVLSEFII